MKNFARTLRLALAYRWTLLGTLLCSLAVALLWGANIGVVYPIVEISFKGLTPPEWIDEKIDDCRQEIVELGGEAAAIEQQLDNGQLPADQQRKLRRRLAYQRNQQNLEHEALAQYEKYAPAVHRYLPFGPFQTIAIVIGALVLGTLIKDVFLVAGHVLTERLAQLSTLRLRKEFFRRTLRMDLGSFGDQTRSDLLARFTNDMNNVTSGVQICCGRAVREPFKAIACLAAAAWICWPLLVLSLLVVPPALWLIARVGRSLRRASRRAMEEMSQLYNILVETFGAIRIVKAFTMERHERNRFHLGTKEFYRKAMKISRRDALVRPLTELMGIGIISMAILAGAYLVINEKTHLFGLRICDRPLNLGQLLLFYALLAGVSDPARKIADVFSQLQRAAAASDRIYEFLDRQPGVPDPAEPVTVGRHRRELAFHDVHFRYHDDQPVLQGVDLRIAFGETLAIVGPNGCGKSTLASLVPRFFDPQQGRIELDGVDLRRMRKTDLRRQVGLVTQDTVLMNDTVMNAIRYGTPEATDEQVIAAAKQAHAHQFISEKLDAGYQTRVGPGGGALSGGQRQRIALARAILRDPAIMILDEATSQIDLQSEQLIQQALAQLLRNRTTLIVTHRLNILDLADRILVMDQGKIADLGPHAELITRCPLYQRLRQLDLRDSA